MAQLTNLDRIQAPPQTVVVDENSIKETPFNYEVLLAEQNGKHGIELNKHLFFVARISIWILYILFIVLLIIWFFHLVTPISWHWLTHEEIQAIERILYASTLISLAGKYFSKFQLLDKK
ncbi:MAG: hypothetical protein BGO69_01380 [Bacteroidetes bacterium 46-16]|nr:MAG: hypothetical protein BGO69_01380 [Bacteroidetes bacterium 46-16]